MKLSEKKKIAVNHIKNILSSNRINEDELGTILNLQSLVNAYREAHTLKLDHGDIETGGLYEYSKPISISSDLKFLI